MTQPSIQKLRAINLESSERELVSQTGSDFSEAKEAIVEGLIGLTEQKCVGSGPEGEVILGSRPSSKLVSGFLLPRFDQAGEDDTSDIHIATMGMDLQIHSNQSGSIALRPQLSIYVRELPSWFEISNPDNDMMPSVQLSRETRQRIEQRARELIQEQVGELPPLPEDEEFDKAGEAIVRAEVSHEAADVSEEARQVGETDTPESKGAARAAAEALDRADRSARAYVRRGTERSEARDQRVAAISAIRKAAFDQAFIELGINLVDAATGAVSRPVTSTDIVDLPTSDATELGIEDSTDADTEAETTTQSEQAEQEEGPPPAAGAMMPLRPDAGTIADSFAAPQHIPQKWRRIPLTLGTIEFDVADPASQQAAMAEFEQRVASDINDKLVAWLASEEGQNNAYRPDERVLPSNFSNEDSWNRFLSALRTRRSTVVDDVKPTLMGLKLIIDVAEDYVDETRANVRLAIQNDAAFPSGRDASAFEHAVFQVQLDALVPEGLHQPLNLDRVQPSYRFSDWLTYPAMGLNCGVRQCESAENTVHLATTWTPRYYQPRIDPTSIVGVPTTYSVLASVSTPIQDLLALPTAYETWINAQAERDVGATLSQELADTERAAHARDIAAYRKEAGYIRAGIELLQRSQASFKQAQEAKDPAERARLQKLSVPYEAWLRTNEAFAAYGGSKFTDWRLFQLAFILAHIPAFVSREQPEEFDVQRDELSASLLYFATGGGKSEAFFGLLIYNLFYDRYRGKLRGVTALVRYPLRLLTLQQARRLMRILVNAELVRLRRKIPGWPFELGFWVGSGNTPNRAAQGFGGVPLITAAAHATDQTLLNPPTDDTDAAEKTRRRSSKYIEALESYDKLRKCPCCGHVTGMRKYPAQHGRIGIVCFNDQDCDWNRLNPASPHREPLPFILTDDTIYQRAPSVVLGTIDKLALLGQHDRTINQIAGMLGVARYMDPQSKHLFSPRGARALAKAEDDGWTRLQPAFQQGSKVFHDPFPSLIIQDEGHLLDESLGTFSGLFETTLEKVLLSLGEGLLSDQVAKWPAGSASPGRPRLAKVIAATATISDPDRQLRVLYQREPLRFPYPGPNLYESFYASPRTPKNSERAVIAQTVAARLRPEKTSPRMRTYVSIMTNGRSHTMTTSAVVSAYHLAVTRLWGQLQNGQATEAVARLRSTLREDDPITPLRHAALSGLLARPNGVNELASLIDLLRISLTYVTNKKGGDQIIETLAAQVERDQRSDGIADLPFTADLISGGVTTAEIQDVMARAEGDVVPGEEFPALGDVLRNIVATSAISHGVDVDKFNAMFFAGMPSDIAEYIQASSRIGRTHVGFSMFVPTPHSRRDRYVVETHDQFHRFLERMIPPPAVQRWADRAIQRVMPSVFQAFLCAVVEQEVFAAAADNAKDRTRTFTSASAIKAWADQYPGGGYTKAVRAITEFALEAVGVNGRGENGIGATTHVDHYKRFVEDRVLELVQRFTDRSDPALLSRFWASVETPTFRKPMTSLRDVDTGGAIIGATRDPMRRRNVNLEAVRQIMKIIRGQRSAARSELDADPAPIDVEDK